MQINLTFVGSNETKPSKTIIIVNSPIRVSCEDRTMIVAMCARMQERAVALRWNVES